MTGDQWREGNTCILGPEDYDGARYCYRHYGFHERGWTKVIPWCDHSPRYNAQQTRAELRAALGWDK